ncbi:MAG: hypothetical protein FWD73_00230 [Polyangiaceae bacterium]|nr:hypothetical protein [Polyangiaceae bacterium]
MRLHAVLLFRALVVTALLLAWVQFARMPVDEQVTFVPDDGFYYLNLGANRAAIGAWSFDNGISTTTGFHLLHAHVAALLAPLFSIEQTHRLLVVHTFLAYALTAAAAWMLGTLASDRFGEGALPGVLVVCTTGAALSCPRMLMEWPYVFALYAAFLSSVSRGNWKRAWMCAFLLPIARTDAVVPVVLTLAVFLIASWRQDRSWRLARPAVIGTVASVAGVGVVSAFVYLHSGFFVQANARMKAHWSASGVAPGRILGVVTRAFAPAFWQIETPRTWAIALFLSLVVVGVVLARWLRRPSERAPALGIDARHLLVASLIALGGITVIYMQKVSAVMPWYCIYAMVPAALCAGAASCRVCRGRGLAVGFGVAVAVIALALWMTRIPIWPHQSRAVAGGAWLRAHPEFAPGAAWNAGIAGYFSGSRIVNIDGLVNDDIHPYIFAGRVDCYLVEKGINVIVDQDCTGRPDAELESLREFPSDTLVDFGRAAGESRCDVRAWRIDRSLLAKRCSAPSPIP